MASYRQTQSFWISCRMGESYRSYTHCHHYYNGYMLSTFCKEVWLFRGKHSCVSSNKWQYCTETWFCYFKSSNYFLHVLGVLLDASSLHSFLGPHNPPCTQLLEVVCRASGLIFTWKSIPFLQDENWTRKNLYQVNRV